jgi:hypothetical protein
VKKVYRFEERVIHWHYLYGCDLIRNQQPQDIQLLNQGKFNDEIAAGPQFWWGAHDTNPPPVFPYQGLGLNDFTSIVKGKKPSIWVFCFGCVPFFGLESFERQGHLLLLDQDLIAAT